MEREEERERNLLPSHQSLSPSLSLFLSFSLSLSIYLSPSPGSLSNNKMGPEGAIALADALRTNTALTEI